MSRNLAKRGIYDVIVVGGGPSGMMAALRAAERGKRVLIIEKNPELGAKLSITGGGRCNIMNGESNVRTLLQNFGAAQEFLHSPFAQFGVQDTYDFFTSHGLPLMTEDRQRVFPKTQKATDVTKLFERLLEHAHVDVILKAPVLEVLHEKKYITGVRTKAQVYTAHSYIIATGGVSHPETGSTGDGHVWLKELGHGVNTPTPNIVPLTVKDTWVKAQKGVSLDDAHLTFTQGTKRIKRHGKMIFTHFGISGPVVLNSARDVQKLLEGGEVTVSLDLFPTIDVGPLRTEVITLFEQHKNKTVRNALRAYVPHGLVDAVLSFFSEEFALKKVHSVSKEERHALVDVLKGLRATVVGTKGYGWAVVSDGGIPLGEVDTRTMASRLYKNLFLTGDVLNISRPSGGFSLQLCWTTGFVAGSHA